LPVLFLIINNGYGMGTAVAEGAAEPDLYKRGCAYRIHGERIDGRDVLVVRDTVRRLRDRAEQEREPAILEAVSFRFRGHSVIAAQLTDTGIVDDGWLKETAARVEREVQEAIDFAEAGPDPQLDDLFEYMYATPVPNLPDARDARALTHPE
jgi:pyruvate dehydrogenase E1 component alpha subunit